MRKLLHTCHSMLTTDPNRKKIYLESSTGSDTTLLPQQEKQNILSRPVIA